MRKVVSVSISETVLGEVDEARGLATRSRYFEYLLEKALKGSPV